MSCSRRKSFLNWPEIMELKWHLSGRQVAELGKVLFREGGETIPADPGRGRGHFPKSRLGRHGEAGVPQS